MKLVSMTDFVLEVINSDRPCNRGEMLEEIGNYAKFLKQPLTLGMFVPCDENSNVLEKPKCLGKGGGWNCDCSESSMQLCTESTTQYRKAQENVLFLGWGFIKKLDDSCEGPNYRFSYHGGVINLGFGYHKNIEGLLELRNIELTESAIKQFTT